MTDKHSLQASVDAGCSKEVTFEQTCHGTIGLIDASGD
jgi:hypothetical protein